MKITDKRDEALKLALEALENTSPLGFNMESDKRFYGAITAIREALAEQPAISAGPITPAMMQGPTPEQKAQMVEAMSKLAEQPAQQQEPVALPEKIYEFVPTPEPVKWHHPECEGQCIACLIEQVVQEAYGSQGLGYLQRHLTSPPASKPWVGLTDEEIKKMHNDLCNTVGSDFKTVARATETKLREKNA